MGVKAGKRAQPEAAFRKQVMDLAALLGYRAVHFKTSLNPRGQHLTVYEGAGKGWPDVFLARPGTQTRRPRLVWIELKAGKNTATPEQEEYLEFLRSCGAEAYLFREGELGAVRAVLDGQ